MSNSWAFLLVLLPPNHDLDARKGGKWPLSSYCMQILYWALFHTLYIIK